jgi:hypothetical protein
VHRQDTQLGQARLLDRVLERIHMTVVAEAEPHVLRQLRDEQDVGPYNGGQGRLRVEKPAILGQEGANLAASGARAGRSRLQEDRQ